jgi:hypothetical protein
MCRPWEKAQFSENIASVLVKYLLRVFQWSVLWKCSTKMLCASVLVKYRVRQDNFLSYMNIKKEVSLPHRARVLVKYFEQVF